MGSVSVRAGEAVYVDANVLIYSVERVQPYVPALDAFWRDVGALQRPALTSELTALEVLVGPLKAGDTALEALFRTALYASPDLRLAQVSRSILERAASLRATTGRAQNARCHSRGDRPGIPLRRVADQRSGIPSDSRPASGGAA